MPRAGLRHRLAVERARAGEWREAVSVLAPVWTAGDEGARAASFDRARLSGDPALEVLVLGEDAASAATAGLVASADLGEALERNGNGAAAQKAFRDVLKSGRSPDAALGLLRTASVAGDFSAVGDALRAIGDMSLDDSSAAIGAAAMRDAELLDAARGEGTARVTERTAADADDAFGDWIEGVRRGDQRQVAGALIDLARLAGGTTSVGPAAHPSEWGRLLARAAARSRLAGRDTAEVIHRRAWASAPGNAAVAQSISDVRAPAPASGADGNSLPDTRSDRAAHLPAAAVGLAVDLDIERALEQEAAGNLGEALEVYSRVLARDAECLEAMLGVRRIARAGRDSLGEARALARLGALVKTPAHAAAFFAEAGPLYERAGYKEQAIAAYLKMLEHAPDDEAAFARAGGAVARRRRPARQCQDARSRARPSPAAARRDRRPGRDDRALRRARRQPPRPARGSRGGRRRLQADLEDRSAQRARAAGYRHAGDRHGSTRRRRALPDALSRGHARRGGSGGGAAGAGARA